MVLTQSGISFLQPQSEIASLNSPVFSPTFNMKVELRSNYFKPTTFIFLSIETIDSSNNQVRTLGYSALNLFINKLNGQPPKSENEIVINLRTKNKHKL